MNLKKLFQKPEFGFYEKRLCVLLFISGASNVFMPLQSLVNQFTPDYRCDVTEFKRNTTKQAETLDRLTDKEWNDLFLNLTIPYENKEPDVYERSSCKQYNILPDDLLNVVESNDTQLSSRPTISCSAYEFNGDARSIVTEFGLVCDQAWKKPIFTSIFMGGMVTSGIIHGLISDRFGRRIAFMLFLIGQFVIALLTSFVSSLALYGIAMFMSGIFSLSSFSASVVLGSEFVCPELRSLTYFSIGVGLSFGYMAMGAVMYFFQDWRWFLRVFALSGIVYIPYFWLVDETPLWLAAKGKVEQLQKIINKIARINKWESKRRDEMKQLLTSRSLAESSSKVCMETARHPKMLGRLIIAAFSWFVASLTYYALALNGSSLSANRFLNVFYGGVAELAGLLLFYMVVDSKGRRTSYMVIMGLCGIGVAVAPFIENGTLLSVLTMSSKILVTAAFALIFMYVGEFFPTPARQSFTGVCFSSARVGGTIAPFVIYAGENGEIIIPSLVMAGIIMLSTASYAFLPETRKERLPQNVEESIKMNGLIEITCCYNNIDDDDKQSRLNDKTNNPEKFQQDCEI
ncbi:organic cation transporter protein-like [Clavelina lepadiformis]|uniref:organic cation transporter protein-like n=1 Tax=Clavelina lepadiformis TaxID=159417 RepID=UPI004041DD11